MQTRFFRFGLVAILVLQLFLGALGAGAQERLTTVDAQPVQPLSSSTRTSKPKTVTLANNTRYSFQLGHRYGYQWKLVINTQGNGNEGRVIDEGRDTYVSTADIDVIPVQQLSDGAYIFQLRMLNPHIWVEEQDATGGSVMEDSMTEAMRTALALPFYYVQQSQGQVERVFFAAEDSEDSQNLKRGIVDSLQLQLDSSASTTAQEQAPNGLVNTTYSRAVTGRTISINKTRSAAGYVRLADPTNTNNPMTMDELTSAEYDPTVGSVRVITYTSRLETPVAPPSDEFGTSTGLGENAFVDSEGYLKLTGISSAPVTEPLPSIPATATPEQIAQTLGRTWNTVYSQGGLIATYSPSTPAVDDNFSMRDALVGLAEDPQGYMPVSKLMDLMQARPRSVLELADMLRQNAVHPSLYPNIAAALAQVGTADAQLVLGELINTTRMSTDLRIEIVNALVGVSKPTAELTAILNTHASNQSDALFEASTVMLGTFASRIASSDAQAASQIVGQLVKALGSTTDEGQIELYLNALGNAGDPSTVSVIEGYVTHSSPFVRMAAVDALRKLPLEQTAELLLKASADSNPAIAEGAQAQLAESLNKMQVQHDNQINATPLWTWQKQVGSGDIYALLHAKVESAKVSGQIYLYAAAAVNVHLWKVTKNDVVKARALSDVYTQNNVSKRRFAVYFFVLGEKLYSKEYEMKCGEVKTGTLVNKTFTFFKVPYSFWVYGLKIKFEAKVGGNIRVDWEYGFNACTPTNSAAWAKLTPSTYVTGSVSVGLDLGLIKAGVTVAVQFLNTKLPAKISATLQNAQLKGCITMSIDFDPVKMRVYGWYKRWKVFGSYWIYKEKDFWNKSFGGYNQTLFNQCRTIG